MFVGCSGIGSVDVLLFCDSRVWVRWGMWCYFGLGMGVVYALKMCFRGVALWLCLQWQCGLVLCGVVVALVGLWSVGQMSVW